jgi:hypothetical protein
MTVVENREVRLLLQSDQATGYPNSTLIYRGSKKDIHMEIDSSVFSDEKRCSCIDGALTKERYLDSIRKAGFQNVEVLSEQTYMDGGEQYTEGKKISSIIIKAVKK